MRMRNLVIVWVLLGLVGACVIAYACQIKVEHPYLKTMIELSK